MCSYVVTSWWSRREPVAVLNPPRWREGIVPSLVCGVSAAVSYYALSTAVLTVQRLYGGVKVTMRQWGADQVLPPGFWLAIPAYVTVATGRRSLFWVSSLILGWVYCSKDDVSTDSEDETGNEEDGHTAEDVDDNSSLGRWVNPATARAAEREVSVPKSDSVFRSIPQENAKSSGYPPRATKPRESQRYLELLVHNVSHTDLVLGLQNQGSETENGKECVVRPRFSKFDVLSRLAMDYVSVDNDPSVVNFPLHHRSHDQRYSICEPDTGSPTTPTGLQLKNPAPLPTTCGLHDVRARDEASLEKLFGNKVSRPTITHVYFPLLATVLPVWKRQIAAKEYKTAVERVLVLVTGVGTPLNKTHEVSGNSTETCAALMKRFLEAIDPNLTVVTIHSETNLFRCDENLVFVDRELMPILHGYRDAHATGNPYPHDRSRVGTHRSFSATAFDAEWRSSMHVTLSSADGSAARTHAIQASLRPFRPTYFHFWQLKTFWHESKIVEDDVEVHSFETMENLPPVDVDQIKDSEVQLVIDEMRSFFHETLVALASTEDNDLHRFWLRKSHQHVLAVVLVRSSGTRSAPQLFRGSNMEVSMPTGSLCAERNAIGTALSMNPKLKRADIKMVAVLGVPPIDATIEDGIPRVHSVASFVEDYKGESTPGSRKHSIGSEDDSGEEWILSDQVDSTKRPSVNSSPIGSDVEDQAPVRRIQLYSKGSITARRGKRTVVVQSTKDMNPLKPCGACNEWLKKIAESNPYFRIITFTDANCNGVYCQPCQD